MAVAKREQAGWDREGNLPERKGLAGRRRLAAQSSPRLRCGCPSSAAIRRQTARHKLTPASEVLKLIQLLPGPCSKWTPARQSWPPLQEDRKLTEGRPAPLCVPRCPAQSLGQMVVGGTTVLLQKPVTPGQGISGNVRPGARRSVPPARSRGQGGDGQERTWH